MIDYTWLIFAVPSVIVASTIHEYAHAYTAYKLGDATAKAEGRLTLNPIAHIDPIGALCMIFLRFGWSKPVPINEYNFQRRERDTALTALAGPLSNVLLLLLLAAINRIFKLDLTSLIGQFLFIFASVNTVLAIFNLIPIPPLDGHKIVRGLLPKRIGYYWDNLEKYSIVLVIILLLPIFKFGSLVSIIISPATTWLLNMTGFF